MKNILLITLSIFLLFTIAGCSSGLSADFQEDYDLFVEAADRMDGRSVENISNLEFFVLLGEVQAHYKNLSTHKWPDQLSAADTSFESAMHSLNLAEEVWDVYKKGSGSWRCSLDRDIGNDVALTLEISERLEDTDESALKWLRSQTCEVIINDLLQNFSLHYSAGKNEMEDYLQ